MQNDRISPRRHKVECRAESRVLCCNQSLRSCERQRENRGENDQPFSDPNIFTAEIAKSAETKPAGAESRPTVRIARGCERERVDGRLAPRLRSWRERHRSPISDRFNRRDHSAARPQAPPSFRMLTAKNAKNGGLSSCLYLRALRNLRLQIRLGRLSVSECLTADFADKRRYQTMKEPF